MKNNSNLKTPHDDGVYLSDASPKDKAWDTHRTNLEIVEKAYQSMGYERYPERMNDCSRLLEFVLKQDSDRQALFKLQGAKFCRVRFCPVCQWRKSLMWRARFFKTVPAIRADYPSHKFLFLTLTVRNCEVENLRETIKLMNRSFRKMVKRKRFPAKGWLKTVEITKSRNGLAHPHFHCILIVNSYYFKTKDYVTKDEWINLWQKSLKVDYKPSVDIKVVGLSDKKRKKVSSRLGKELTDNEAISYSLIECLKYSVKEADLISDPQWLDAITQQMHNSQTVSLGGLFRKYLSENEPEDLIHDELTQDIEISETDVKLLFGWKENKKRYRSM